MHISWARLKMESQTCATTRMKIYQKKIAEMKAGDEGRWPTSVEYMNPDRDISKSDRFLSIIWILANLEV